jgi:hypothetical protein
MPEQLLAAVHVLTETVEKLEATLHEYPKRDEVESTFATKKESKRRAFRVLMLGLVMMFISLFVSYLVTVSTISTCFLTNSARTGDGVAACHWLPGYPETQRDSRVRLDQFMKLLEVPPQNDARLDRIERELDLPPMEFN